jgi:hypothetical protein
MQSEDASRTRNAKRGRFAYHETFAFQHSHFQDASPDPENLPASREKASLIVEFTIFSIPARDATIGRRAIRQKRGRQERDGKEREKGRYHGPTLSHARLFIIEFIKNMEAN